MSPGLSSEYTTFTLERRAPVTSTSNRNSMRPDYKSRFAECGQTQMPSLRPTSSRADCALEALRSESVVIYSSGRRSIKLPERSPLPGASSATSQLHDSTLRGPDGCDLPDRLAKREAV